MTPLKSGASGKPLTLVEFVLEMDVAGWSSLFGIRICTYPAAHLRNSLLSMVPGPALCLHWFFCFHVDNFLSLAFGQWHKIWKNIQQHKCGSILNHNIFPFDRVVACK